jgi:hypothetical protein
MPLALSRLGFAWVIATFGDWPHGIAKVIGGCVDQLRADSPLLGWPGWERQEHRGGEDFSITQSRYIVREGSLGSAAARSVGCAALQLWGVPIW